MQYTLFRNQKFCHQANVELLVKTRLTWVCAVIFLIGFFTMIGAITVCISYDYISQK